MEMKLVFWIAHILLPVLLAIAVIHGHSKLLSNASVS